MLRGGSTERMRLFNGQCRRTVSGEKVGWVVGVKRDIYIATTDLGEIPLAPEDIAIGGNLHWMAVLYDKGIFLSGREVYEGEKLVEKRGSDVVAEIIIHDYEPTVWLENMYLVRWQGEDMASATWIIRSDLIPNCRVLLYYYLSEASSGKDLADYVPRKLADADSGSSAIPVICGSGHVGCKRKLFIYNKHRKESMKKLEEAKKEEICVFSALTSQYPSISSEAKLKLRRAFKEPWASFLQELSDVLPSELKAVHVLHNSNAIGTLAENLKELKYGTFFICCKGNVPPHCGVLIDGEPLTIIMRRKMKGCKAKFKEWPDEQLLLKRYMSINIKDLGVFRIVPKEPLPGVNLS
eukprot:TRINITY_DN1677_c0_g1_i1.p3 TRINITY_DN1677_c0_g1~~TRINITY_DN1677_c0_g1_i1.p3  ORF type:complete len:352 (-),score=16.23 TRINITY_DN1677_c0_g1_i1:396-1451(-)